MEESETEFRISQRQQLPKDESEIRSAKNEQGQSEAQNDFDPEQYMLGEATFWQQLKATIIRNLIRKRRGLRQTLNVSMKVGGFLILFFCNKIYCYILGNNYSYLLHGTGDYDEICDTKSNLSSR